MGLPIQQVTDFIINHLNMCAIWVQATELLLKVYADTFKKLHSTSLSQSCTLFIPLNIWPAKSISITDTVHNVKNVRSKLKSLILVI